MPRVWGGWTQSQGGSSSSQSGVTQSSSSSLKVEAEENVPPLSFPPAKSTGSPTQFRNAFPLKDSKHLDKSKEIQCKDRSLKPSLIENTSEESKEDDALLGQKQSSGKQGVIPSNETVSTVQVGQEGKLKSTDKPSGDGGSESDVNDEDVLGLECSLPTRGGGLGPGEMQNRSTLPVEEKCRTQNSSALLEKLKTNVVQSASMAEKKDVDDVLKAKSLQISAENEQKASGFVDVTKESFVYDCETQNSQSAERRNNVNQSKQSDITLQSNTLGSQKLSKNVQCSTDENEKPSSLANFQNTKVGKQVASETADSSEKTAVETEKSSGQNVVATVESRKLGVVEKEKLCQLASVRNGESISVTTVDDDEKSKQLDYAENEKAGESIQNEENCGTGERIQRNKSFQAAETQQVQETEENTRVQSNIGIDENKISAVSKISKTNITAGDMPGEDRLVIGSNEEVVAKTIVEVSDTQKTTPVLDTNDRHGDIYNQQDSVEESTIVSDSSRDVNDGSRVSSTGKSDWECTTDYSLPDAPSLSAYATKQVIFDAVRVATDAARCARRAQQSAAIAVGMNGHPQEQLSSLTTYEYDETQALDKESHLQKVKSVAAVLSPVRKPRSNSTDCMAISQTPENIIEETQGYDVLTVSASGSARRARTDAFRDRAVSAALNGSMQGETLTQMQEEERNEQRRKENSTARGCSTGGIVQPQLKDVLLKANELFKPPESLSSSSNLQERTLAKYRNERTPQSTNTSERRVSQKVSIDNGGNCTSLSDKIKEMPQTGRYNGFAVDENGKTFDLRCSFRFQANGVICGSGWDIFKKRRFSISGSKSSWHWNADQSIATVSIFSSNWLLSGDFDASTRTFSGKWKYSNAANESSLESLSERGKKGTWTLTHIPSDEGPQWIRNKKSKSKGKGKEAISDSPTEKSSNPHSLSTYKSNLPELGEFNGYIRGCNTSYSFFGKWRFAERGKISGLVVVGPRSLSSKISNGSWYYDESIKKIRIRVTWGDGMDVYTGTWNADDFSFSGSWVSGKNGLGTGSWKAKLIEERRQSNFEHSITRKQGKAESVSFEIPTPRAKKFSPLIRELSGLYSGNASRYGPIKCSLDFQKDGSIEGWGEDSSSRGTITSGVWFSSDDDTLCITVVWSGWEYTASYDSDEKTFSGKWKAEQKVTRGKKKKSLSGSWTVRRVNGFNMMGKVGKDSRSKRNSQRKSSGVESSRTSLMRKTKSATKPSTSRRRSLTSKSKSASKLSHSNRYNGFALPDSQEPLCETRKRLKKYLSKKDKVTTLRSSENAKAKRWESPRSKIRNKKTNVGSSDTTKMEYYADRCEQCIEIKRSERGQDIIGSIFLAPPCEALGIQGWELCVVRSFGREGCPPNRPYVVELLKSDVRALPNIQEDKKTGASALPKGREYWQDSDFRGCRRPTDDLLEEIMTEELWNKVVNTEEESAIDGKRRTRPRKGNSRQKKPKVHKSAKKAKTDETPQQRTKQKQLFKSTGEKSRRKRDRERVKKTKEIGRDLETHKKKKKRVRLSMDPISTREMNERKIAEMEEKLKAEMAEKLKAEMEEKFEKMKEEFLNRKGQNQATRKEQNQPTSHRKDFRRKRRRDMQLDDATPRVTKKKKSSTSQKRCFDTPLPRSRSSGTDASRVKPLERKRFMITGYTERRQPIAKTISDLGGVVVPQVLGLKNAAKIPTYVIARAPAQRTIKYLHSLALGVPALHLDWLQKCRSQAKAPSMEGFALPAGYSSFARKFIMLNVSQRKNKEYEKDIFRPDPTRKKVLEGMKIGLAISKNTSNHSRQLKEWKQILNVAGAEVVHKKKWIQNGGESDIDLILQHYSTFVGKDFELFNITTPEQKLGYKCVKAFECGIPVLSFAWLLQSLVHQKAMPFDPFLLYDDQKSFPGDTPNSHVIWDSIGFEDESDSSKTCYSRFVLKRAEERHPFDVGEFVTLSSEDNGSTKILARITGAWETEDGDQRISYNHYMRCEKGSSDLCFSHAAEASIDSIGDRIVVLPHHLKENLAFEVKESGSSDGIFFLEDEEDDSSDESEESDDESDDDDGRLNLIQASQAY